MTGLTIPQEYVCLALEKFERPPTVVLTIERHNFFIDVSQSHLFLGYKPLVMALTFSEGDHQFEIVRQQNFISLSLNNDSFEINSRWLTFPADSSSIARLKLKKVGERVDDNKIVIFYEGVHGAHSFLNPVHQLINRQLSKIKTVSPNNVSLPGNLVDQVRIAYASPRVISIIITSDGKSLNMFPTDLHGPLWNNAYIGSLRSGGVANTQVISTKKIVVADIRSDWYKEAYALGKNHMKDFQNAEEFSLYQEKSSSYNFALPKAVIRYRELDLTYSWSVGIHTIHHYQIVNVQQVQPGLTLAHIHQYYAQWRLNHGIKNEFLWR